MSWDLVAFRVDQAPVAEDGVSAAFPENWMPPEIGALEEVRRVLSAVFPESDWNEPCWGQYETGAASLEFNIGREDPCTNIMIHARGDAVPSILKIIEKTGWRILDCSTNRWMHLVDDPEEGLQQFQAYLEKAMAREPERPPRRSLLDRLFRR